jgi:hypothetical protein
LQQARELIQAQAQQLASMSAHLSQVDAEMTELRRTMQPAVLRASDTSGPETASVAAQ